MEEDSPQYLPENGGAKSVSAWFKLGEDYSTTDNYCIAGFGSPVNGQDFQLNISQNNLGVRGYGSGYNWLPAVSAPSDNNWHHMVATYNGSTTRLYLDGVERDNTTSYSFPTNNPERIIIGNDIDKSGREFHGFIDDVGLYQKALNHKEILDLYHVNGWNTDPDLVAYYPFNGNCNDESGNNYHLKPHYSVGISSDRFDSDWQAYNFNKSEGWDGFIGPASGDFDNLPSGNVPKTVSAWFRLNGSYDDEYGYYDIAGFGDVRANGHNFQLSIRYNSLGVKGWGASYDWFPEVPPPSGNNWHHIAATYDGTTTRLYLDGGQVAITSDYTFSGTNPQTIVIGNEIDYSGWEFTGDIDDVRIFKRCLSGSDVNDLYQEGGY
ncbi:LamG domain-containing protein [Fibrobacterota bacterium]